MTREQRIEQSAWRNFLRWLAKHSARDRTVWA